MLRFLLRLLRRLVLLFLLLRALLRLRAIVLASHGRSFLPGGQKTAMPAPLPMRASSHCVTKCLRQLPCHAIMPCNQIADPIPSYLTLMVITAFLDPAL